MLEAHPAAVVAAHDSIDAIASFNGDIDPAGAGVTRVLQQFANKNPGVPSIATRLMKRPPTEFTCNGHELSVIPKVSDSGG